MDELVTQIVNKTGISPDQARMAVETVVGFIKPRLPEMVAGHLDSALGLAGSGLGNLDADDVKSALGSLFGNR
jgi:hypothetical protein